MSYPWPSRLLTSTVNQVYNTKLHVQQILLLLFKQKTETKYDILMFSFLYVSIIDKDVHVG